MSKMGKKTLFHHILALKYWANCQNIRNIYSSYRNATIMEQIKPNILNIYLKTVALPPIEAFLAISKIENLLSLNCLDKNYYIFQTTRFNHTMIFFNLTD